MYTAKLSRAYLQMLEVELSRLPIGSLYISPRLIGRLVEFFGFDEVKNLCEMLEEHLTKVEVLDLSEGTEVLGSSGEVEGFLSAYVSAEESQDNPPPGVFTAAARKERQIEEKVAEYLGYFLHHGGEE